MSGFKKALVTISEEEYRRLHNVEMERIYKQNSNRNERDQRGHIQQAYQQNILEMQQRQQEYERILEYFQADVRNMEIETERRRAQEQAGFFQQVSQEVDDIWENAGRLEQVLADFQTRHEQDVQFLYAHNRNTNRRIDTIVQRQREKYEMVIAWLESAGALGQYINQQYDHERFTPGRLMQVYQGLEQAEQNIRTGMLEAAVVQVQGAFSQLSSLRLELEQLTTTWQSMFEITYKAALQLYHHVKDNPSCNALDMEGKELPAQLSLNYWSDGKWDALRMRLKDFISRLRNEKKYLQTRDLEFILQKQLKDFQGEFETIVYETRFAALNSHLREEIAELALQALKPQGYQEAEFGYEAGDLKSPYILRMNNIGGSEVTIRIAPVSDMDHKNNIFVESNDAEKMNERELRGRFNEIRTSLEHNGLMVGEIQQNSRNAAVDTGIALQRSNRNMHKLAGASNG